MSSVTPYSSQQAWRLLWSAVLLQLYDQTQSVGFTKAALTAFIAEGKPCTTHLSRVLHEPTTAH